MTRSWRSATVCETEIVKRAAVATWGAAVLVCAAGCVLSTETPPRGSPVIEGPTGSPPTLAASPESSPMCRADFTISGGYQGHVTTLLQGGPRRIGENGRGVSLDSIF